MIIGVLTHVGASDMTLAPTFFSALFKKFLQFRNTFFRERYMLIL